MQEASLNLKAFRYRHKANSDKIKREEEVNPAS